MAASYGYTKTAYNAQGGDDAGGFVFGGSQGGSQGQGGNKAINEDSLRPVTIKQILDCEESYGGSNEFRIDGAQVTQITFVGQVRGITQQPTHVNYKLDDGTGIVEVKKWVDADKMETDGEALPELSSYVRVWGRLKSFSNKKHVGAHVIRPVTDLNEVNHHLLEAAYVHLYFTHGPPGQQNGGAGGAGGDGMFVEGGGSYGGAKGAGGAYMDSRLASVSPVGVKLFNYIQNAPGGNDGVHIDVMAQAMNLSVRDVKAAMDELLGAAVVYTTMDDDTFAILET